MDAWAKFMTGDLPTQKEGSGPDGRFFLFF